MSVTTLRNPWWRFPHLVKRQRGRDRVKRWVLPRRVRLWIKLGIGAMIVVWLVAAVWVTPVH